MIHCIIIALSIALCVSFSNQAMAVEHVRLEATADASFSSMLYKGVDYRITSMGKYNQFKLKSVQEMAAIKFNCDPARGREVVSARLYLHNATEGNRIRILRMSTINGDWNEGDQTEKYGPPSGACFNYADWDTKKEWGWPGSQLCDVVLGAGHSLTTWKERREEKDGWISVPVPPELIYAMCVGDSDGLLLQDAGDLSFTNNFMHSRESGRFAPYMELQLGAALSTKPSTPVVSAMPAPEVAKQDSGSIKIKIAEASNTH